MEREDLRQLLLEHDSRRPKQDVIARDLFSKLVEKTKSPFIVIVSGIRRSGKSTLLGQLRGNLDGYFVNFDDDRLVDFTVKDFQTMYELLIELFGKKEVFFFDEIQNIKAWERFVRRLHDEGKKVFITGSNATMLSKELGTHLTGRNIPYSLYPFSFVEFLRFKGQIYKKLDRLTTKDKSLLKRKFHILLTKITLVYLQLRVVKFPYKNTYLFLSYCYRTLFANWLC